MRNGKVTFQKNVHMVIGGILMIMSEGNKRKKENLPQEEKKELI